ncbi:MAG: MFS transporter [Bryobacteraceae bacterium]
MHAPKYPLAASAAFPFRARAVTDPEPAPRLAGPRLDRLPVCRFHWRLLGLIGAGLFVDALDLYIQGAVLAELVRTGESTASGNATFLSMTFAGLTLGSLSGGWLADRFGRRRLYQLNLLVFGLATLAAAFAPDFGALLACRFVAGLGLGAEVITAYGTLTEFVPARERGVWQGRLSALSNLGLPVSALMAWVLIPRFGWRSLFAVVGVLSFVVWFTRKYMPESPRWYESRNRHVEAEATLRDIESEVERLTGSRLDPVTAGAVAPEAGFPARALFRGPMARRMTLAITLMVAMNFTLYAFTGWFPTILVQKGVPIARTLLITTLVQLGSLPGAFLGAWVMDRFGRKTALIAISTLGAVVSATYSSIDQPAALVAIGFLLVALIYCLLAITYGAYVPEIFPTTVRLTGFGFSNAAGRLSNVIAPYGVALLLRAYGAGAVYVAIAGALVVQAMAVAWMGEETRRRSLEDIARTPSSG